MARRLVQTAATLCDWHGNLPQPEQVDASTTRRLNAAKEIDLCGFCGLVWDLVFPRKDELLQMLQPDVCEALLRSAHSVQDEEPEEAKPRQLAIQEETPAKALEAKPEPTTRKLAHKRGVRVEGVEQVICPLDHRTGSPTPYWVALRDRGSHAKSSHHVLAPEVPYKLPDPGDPDAFELPVKCFEHQVCADAGGYGFKDDSGLTLHLTKAKHWPKAKDATATPDQPATQQAPAA